MAALKNLTMVFFLLLPHALFAANVLMIGDSQTAGIYGKELDRLLRVGGNTVETHGVPGSIAKWWFSGEDTRHGYMGIDKQGNKIPGNGSTPILTTLLKESKPDYVIMQFGGNYRGYNSAFIKNDFQKMIDAVKAAGVKCMVVTGPKSNYKAEANKAAIDALKEAVGSQCEVFDSTAVTVPPANSELHYNPSNSSDVNNAKNWASLVNDRFNKISSPSNVGSGSVKTLKTNSSSKAFVH